jgi:hypothetical protein
MTFLSDRNKVAQVPQFHLPYPLNMKIAISILWLNPCEGATIETTPIE